MNEAGNGVSVWNAPGAKVLDNEHPASAATASSSIASRKQRVPRQPLPRPALRRPLHVHQRQRGQRTTSRPATLSATRSCIRTGLTSAATCRTATATTASCSTSPTARRSPATRRGAPPGRRALDQVGPARATRRASTACPADDEPERTLAAGDRIGPEKCVFIYNTNKNASATTGSRAARSASTSPPARRATRSPATPSSATGTR